MRVPSRMTEFILRPQTPTQLPRTRPKDLQYLVPWRHLILTCSSQIPDGTTKVLVPAMLWRTPRCSYVCRSEVPRSLLTRLRI